MTLQMKKTADEPQPHPRPGPPRNYNTAWVAAAALLALIVVVLGAYLAFRSDSGDGGFGLADDTTTSVGESTDLSATSTVPEATTVSSGPTTSEPAPTSATSSGSSVSTSSPATTLPTSQPVVWPDPGESTGFDSPEEAARSFAVDLAGFTEPRVGEFRAGDGRSGEIEIRPSDTGPVTTILLRQVAADESWWVIGAVSEDIVIDQPSTGQVVTGTMLVAGEARAFEGTVDVALFAHGQTEPLVTGFVTGRGDGELGAFEESFDVPASASGPGFLLLTSPNADDGAAWTVAAIPVEFG